MTTSKRRSLKGVVGQKTYGSWVDMVRVLAPDGRTHRLAPLIAAMLHYGVAKASSIHLGSSPELDSVARSLLIATEVGDPTLVGDEVRDLVEGLFRDAGIGHGRVDHRGNRYSVADAAIQEFIRWHDMPWEA